ncbi:MAG: hypothetical protein RLN85_15655, partial [Pseudomonadales bacterium]
ARAMVFANRLSKVVFINIPLDLPNPLIILRFIIKFKFVRIRNQALVTTHTETAGKRVAQVVFKKPLAGIAAMILIQS